MPNLILPWLSGFWEPLRKKEEENRTNSILLINSIPKTKDVMEIVSASLEIIFVITIDFTNRTDDELTLQQLGIRLFNLISSSLMLLVAGYYQISVMVLRDVLETGFLLDYFSLDRSNISIWKKSSSKERRQSYKPSNIRKVLDKRDGFNKNENYRDQLYSIMSEYATHPTPSGVMLISPKGGGRIGPFFEKDRLEHIVEEFALRIPYFTLIYINLFNDLPYPFSKRTGNYLRKVKDWSLKYLGMDLSIIDLEQRKAWIKISFESKAELDRRGKG